MKVNDVIIGLLVVGACGMAGVALWLTKLEPKESEVLPKPPVNTLIKDEKGSTRNDTGHSSSTNAKWDSGATFALPYPEEVDPNRKRQF